MQRSIHVSPQKPWPVAMGLVVVTALLAPLLGLDMVVGTGYHDTQRWMQLVVLAAVAVWVLQQVRRDTVRWPSRTTQGLWLGLLAGGAGGASSAMAAFPLQAAFELGIFFFLSLTAWRIATEVALASNGAYRRPWHGSRRAVCCTVSRHYWSMA